MLNAGDRLQLLNMERQEPIFLLQNDNYQNGVFASHSTHVRLQLAGERYCLVYCRPALPSQGTGQTIYYSGLGKIGSVLPNHLLTVEALVPRILQDIRMLDAGVRTRALSLRADTLKRCIDYGDQTRGRNRTHYSSLIETR